MKTDIEANRKITIALSPEAYNALEELRPRGERTKGRYISELILREQARKEAIEEAQKHKVVIRFE